MSSLELVSDQTPALAFPRSKALAELDIGKPLKFTLTAEVWTSGGWEAENRREQITSECLHLCAVNKKCFDFWLPREEREDERTHRG